MENKTSNLLERIIAEITGSQFDFYVVQICTLTFTLANWGQGLNILLVHNLEHVTICWIWFFSLDEIFNKMIYHVWYLMFRIKPQINQIF